jgi:penicillin-binding protein 2
MVIQSPPNRPDPPPDKNQMMIRAATLGVIAVVLFGVLVFRLWALQVLHSDHYVAQANQNDVRQLPLPAPRGEIEDSTGKVLVKNTSHVLAEVNPAGLATPVVCTTFAADQRAKCNAVVAATPPGAVPRCAALKGQTRCLVLARLGRVLGMKPHEVWRAYERTLFVNADGSGGCTPTAAAPCYVVNAGPPIPLKPASEPEVAYVLERRSQFPGVQFLQTTQRQYPFGDLAPNVLGYVSQISQAELKDSNFAGLTGGAMVGQAGAEYSYDRQLRGVDGLLEQNYDATGRAVGPTYVQRAAQPGDTLQLTIDSRLQKIAQKAVAYGIQVAHNDGEVTAHTGAIVAMNPQNGQIYAMASYPSYNPSVFLPPAKNAGKLYKDTYNQPLIDKTLEPKAPGSTFKPITATAAWNSGVLGPGTTLDCPGVFYRPGDFSHTPFPNWTTANLGTMNLPTALEQSCNTFFFQLGSKMYDLPNQGIAFQKTIRQYGFGKTPPMDLPVSPYFSGLVPDAAWRLQTYSKPIDQVWQPGYDIQMAIGQGDLTVSPMQLAVAYSAIANGGKLVTPHIGKALLDSQGNVVKRFDPAPQRDLNLSPELLSEIRQGLYEASHSSLGTSSSVFGSYTPAVAGKTGTAEHPPDPSPNAWFASFAPADNPKLVVVALINDGGHGGVSAAPAARQVYQGFFHQKITNTVGTDASR